MSQDSRKENFFSLSSLTSNNLEPMKKKASKFGRRALSSNKSIKNVHVYKKAPILHVGTNNQLPIACNPPKN